MWYFPWNSVSHVPVLLNVMSWSHGNFNTPQPHTIHGTGICMVCIYIYILIYSINIHHSWIGRSKDEGARPSVYLDESPSYRALGPYWKRLRRHKTYASSPVVYWWDSLDAHFLRVLNCSFDEAYKWDMVSGYSHTNATAPSRNKALLRTTNHHCPLVRPFFFGVVIGRVPPKHRQGLIHPINPVILFVCFRPVLFGGCLNWDRWKTWVPGTVDFLFLELQKKKGRGLLKTNEKRWSIEIGAHATIAYM